MIIGSQLGRCFQIAFIITLAFIQHLHLYTCGYQFRFRSEYYNEIQNPKKQVLSPPNLILRSQKTFGLSDSLVNNALTNYTLSESSRKKIENLIQTAPIVLFIKGTPSEPQCGFSKAVIEILKACRVKNFNAINVLDGTSIREDIKSYSNWPTIPQVFIKGNFIGGYDILLEMFQSGELIELLNNEKLLY